MTRAIEKTLFTFDELDDAAKDKARDWWRESAKQDDLLDRDDFETVAKILGVEFDARPVKLMGGGTRYESKIYFSGFSSQGDGACFEGTYSYAKQCSKKIRKHAPQDQRLHKIADDLTALQRKRFYRIGARMTHRGHYYHSGCMSVDVYASEGDTSRETDEDIRDLMRAFADWIYRQLELEYEYRMSNEQVDENIRCNEYVFYENGRID